MTPNVETGKVGTAGSPLVQGALRETTEYTDHTEGAAGAGSPCPFLAPRPCGQRRSVLCGLRILWFRAPRGSAADFRAGRFIRGLAQRSEDHGLAPHDAQRTSPVSGAYGFALGRAAGAARPGQASKPANDGRVGRGIRHTPALAGSPSPSLSVTSDLPFRRICEKLNKTRTSGALVFDTKSQPGREPGRSPLSVPPPI